MARRVRITGLLVVLIVSAFGGVPSGASFRRSPCRGRPPRHWRHVVWVVMENHSYNQIIGSSAAPYMNRLAGKCGLATNFHAISHPSLPNYIAMTSGRTHGIADDDPPSAHPLRGKSIFSQLHGDWRSLEESMPSRCALSSSGTYAVKHNPAAYYRRIRRGCYRHDVPYHLGGPLNTSARFTFVTPNICDDMHDCSVATGDAWLKRFMTKLLRKHSYRRGRAAVFITFDEGSDGSAGNRIPTIVVARSVHPGKRSAAPFTLYSLLRTTESMLHLGKLHHAADARGMRASFNL
jgi:phosphatidylinositol-3-phosphatase